MKSMKIINTPTKVNENIAKNPSTKSKFKTPLIIGGSVVGVIVVLVLVLILIFTSSPIGKILTKLQKHESYHMTVTISEIWLLGSLTFEQFVDEDIKYTPASFLSEEKYEHTVGKDMYVYTKSKSGDWEKTKAESAEGSIESIGKDLFGDFDALTNPKNYEAVDGEKNKYKQKDGIEFGGCKDVLITLGENDVTITMTINFQGLPLPATVVISEIGEVDLTLPNT